MNTWQIPQQIAFLLQCARWEDSGQEVVFDKRSVLVSSAVVFEALPGIHPIALVSPGQGTPDPELIGLSSDAFNVRLILGRDDQVGEKVLIGGNRKPSGGQGSSEGRGLLEIEEQVLRTIERLDDVVGIRIGGGFRTVPEAVYDQQMGYLAARVLTFEIDVTRARYYHPPRDLVATALGSGQVSLTWAMPANRFDFHDTLSIPDLAARGKIVVRRSAGSSPPALPTTGQAVLPQGGDHASSLTDTPGAGTWTYALFAGYDEMGEGSVERYSAQELGSTRTVVAT